MVRLYTDYTSFLLFSKGEPSDGFFLPERMRGLTEVIQLAKDRFLKQDPLSASSLKGRKNVFVFVDSFGADPEGEQQIKEIEGNGCRVGAIFTLFATQQTGASNPLHAEDVPIIPLLTLETLIRHLPQDSNRSRLQAYRDAHAPTTLKLSLPLNIFRS